MVVALGLLVNERFIRDVAGYLECALVVLLWRPLSARPSASLDLPIVGFRARLWAVTRRSYRDIKKLAPESHGAHSKVRNSMLWRPGSISVSFIGLRQMGHGSSVV